jgi:hypothetical protein
MIDGAVAIEDDAMDCALVLFCGGLYLCQSGPPQKTSLRRNASSSPTSIVLGSKTPTDMAEAMSAGRLARALQRQGHITPYVCFELNVPGSGTANCWTSAGTTRTTLKACKYTLS